MNCDCCGRKKKLFESFESITPDINLCVDCSTILYKYRDGRSDNNKEQCDALIADIERRGKTSATEAFINWFETFK